MVENDIQRLERLKEKFQEALRQAATGSGAAGNFAVCDGYADLMLARNQAERGPGVSVPKPAVYLTSWKEILVTLGLSNNAEDRRRVAKLSADYDGPIVIPGQGAQPKAEKSKLVEWWNHLETVWHAQAQQAAGRQADAESQHDWGREGTAAPSLGGGVRRRRRDRKP
jgi:hypothetical protein